MLRTFALIAILLISGCASYDYTCTDGTTTYLADDHSAIIVSEERVVIGTCERMD